MKVSTKKINIKAELPYVLEVSDYHEFNDYEWFLRQLFGQQLKVEELNAPANPYYLGLVYAGKRPTKLIKDLELSYQEEDDGLQDSPLV